MVLKIIIIIVLPFPTVGTFDPITRIDITNTSYTIHVSWDPPLHHPAVPPTGYNITVINTTSSDTISSASISNTEYSFELLPTQLCSVLIIRVAAFNQWLTGHPGERVWSLGGMLCDHVGECL